MSESSQRMRDAYDRLGGVIDLETLGSTAPSFRNAEWIGKLVLANTPIRLVFVNNADVNAVAMSAGMSSSVGVFSGAVITLCEVARITPALLELTPDEAAPLRNHLSRYLAGDYDGASPKLPVNNQAVLFGRALYALTVFFVVSHEAYHVHLGHCKLAEQNAVGQVLERYSSNQEPSARLLNHGAELSADGCAVKLLGSFLVRHICDPSGLDWLPPEPEWVGRLASCAVFLVFFVFAHFQLEETESHPEPAVRAFFTLREIKDMASDDLRQRGINIGEGELEQFKHGVDEGIHYAITLVRLMLGKEAADGLVERFEFVDAKALEEAYFARFHSRKHYRT